MRRTNNSLWAMLAVTISAVGFYYCWQFLIPTYKTNQTQLAQIEIEKKAAKDKLSSLTQAKSTLSQLGDTLNRILVAYPKDKDAPNIISEFEAMAASHKTTIASFSLGNADADTGKVDISFSVLGNFTDINALIKSIENDAKFMSIQSVSLSQSAEYTSLSIHITAYKQLSSVSQDETSEVQ